MSSEGRSYLKYMAIGCFGTFLVLIVIGLAIVFGGKYALDYAMEQFADENPTAFSESTLSPEESAILKEKFDSFFTGQGGDLSLEMNSDEINHLIANHPEFSDFNDKVRFKIEGSQMKTQLSLPMDDFKKCTLTFLKVCCRENISTQTLSLISAPRVSQWVLMLKA